MQRSAPGDPMCRQAALRRGLAWALPTPAFRFSPPPTTPWCRPPPPDDAQSRGGTPSSTPAPLWHAPSARDMRAASMHGARARACANTRTASAIELMPGNQRRGRGKDLRSTGNCRSLLLAHGYGRRPRLEFMPQPGFGTMEAGFDRRKTHAERTGDRAIREPHTEAQ
jgi:hypothetical protein